MTKITIELPKEYEFMKEIPSFYWVLAAKRIQEEREGKLKKIARIREIASKSKATDNDVEEITNEVKEAVWKHYEKYAK